MKRIIPPIIIVFSLLFGASTIGMAQVKSGGFLGFKKKGSQVSGDLFPDTSLAPPTPPSADSSPDMGPDDEGDTGDIFRKPGSGIFREDAEPVVERSQGRKFGFSLPFGKKKSDDTNLISVPVPPTAPRAVESTNADAPPSAPVAQPQPVQVASTPEETVEDSGPAPVRVGDEPVFDSGDEEEEKGGVFSFLSWKDKKKADDSPPPLPADTTMQTTDDGVVIIKADRSAVQESQSSPGSLLVGNESNEDNASGGLFSGLTKPKERKRKDVDYSSFETVMENGEFVDAEKPDYTKPAAPATAGGENAPAPEVINGVKTYSTWDQVGGRSVSAAEKILNNAR